MSATTLALEPFVRQWAILLTTYRRDGTPVGTPVNIVVEADHAFIRTWDTAGKLGRIRNNPEVEVCPSTAHASRALARRYPISHGVLVPALHRLRGNETVHIELTPIDQEESPK